MTSSWHTCTESFFGGVGGGGCGGVMFSFLFFPENVGVRFRCENTKDIRQSSYRLQGPSALLLFSVRRALSRRVKRPGREVERV